MKNYLIFEIEFGAGAGAEAGPMVEA